MSDGLPMADKAQRACAKCGYVKPVRSFRRERNSCKSCDYLAQKERYKNKSEDAKRAIRKQSNARNAAYLIRKKNDPEWKVKAREKRKLRYVVISKDPEWRLKRQRQLRASRLRTKYGMTEYDFRIMIEMHEEKCPVCKNTFSDKIRSKFAVVDHCHSTGRVRGLLCNKCNSAVGLLKDNVNVIERAALYLIING